MGANHQEPSRYFQDSSKSDDHDASNLVILTMEPSKKNPDRLFKQYFGGSEDQEGCFRSIDSNRSKSFAAVRFIPSDQERFLYVDSLTSSGFFHSIRLKPEFLKSISFNRRITCTDHHKSSGLDYVMCADEILTEGDRCRRWCTSLYKYLGVSRSGCAQCVGTKHSRREAVGVVGTVRHCDQAMYMEACSFQPSSLSLRSSLAVSLALAARRCSWECASKRDQRIEHSMTHKRWGHVSYPACQPVLACLL